MSLALRIADLSDEQAMEAFPLIQATWPQTEIGSWQRFVAFFNGSAAKAGVLALRDPKGYICGVLAYRLDRELQKGAILAVQLFTAVDLANSPATIRALLDAAEMRALDLDCAGIEIRLRHEQSALGSRLRMLGLSAERGLLWKGIDPAPSYN